MLITKNYRPVTPKSVPPKIGPAGPILAKKPAKSGPPGPLLLPKSVRPDQFWQPKLVPLANFGPLGGPILARSYLPKSVPLQDAIAKCVS